MRSASSVAPSASRQYGLQHDELVAPEPGERVADPERAPHPIDNPAQQHVAHRMTVGVVDILEMIEVEQHEGELPAVPARLLGGLPQPIVKHGPIR